MSIVGNEKIRKLIPKLSSVRQPMLWIGPEGVGKRSYALTLLKDVEHKRVLINPSVDEVVSLVKWAKRKKELDLFKVAVVEITEASPQAVSAMLGFLENLPQNFKIILIHSTCYPPEQVRTRCMTYRFDALSDKDIEQVLIYLGHPEGSARSVSSKADGSVTQALRILATDHGPQQISELLRRDSPSEQAEQLLGLSDVEKADGLIIQGLIEDRRLTPSMLAILSQGAGVAGKALVAFMFMPERNEDDR